MPQRIMFLRSTCGVNELEFSALEHDENLNTFSPLPILRAWAMSAMNISPQDTRFASVGCGS